MRLTDHRYSQQRDRLEVALRMIRHQARTSTIRECTGISEDRIRKLHIEYQSGSMYPRRKRGKSPQQLYCLSHNLQARTDAALMAGVYQSIGVLDELRDGRMHKKINFRTAARICDAYELFASIRPVIQQNEFSFEHAWLLIRALDKGDELTVTTCPQCASQMLLDRYAPRRSMCPICEIKRLADSKKPSRRKRHNTAAAADS